MATIKIFMVDDHRTMTDGLSEYFRVISTEERSYQVIGRVQSGPELLQRLSALPAVDVVLMDLEMPAMSGFELVEKALAIRPGLPIIVLTMHNSWSYANELIRKGSRGYALKTSGGKAIVEAIRLVLQGKIYIDPDIDPQSVGEVPVEWTPEDREIICLILAEHTSEQIARLLARSEEYVEGRRRAILRATGARNVIGIVKYALRKKFCPEVESGRPDAAAHSGPKGLTWKNSAVRVFLVDDHALLLDSLEAMLRTRMAGLPAIEVVGKAHSGTEALEQLAGRGDVDVVLLDKELPDVNGIRVIEQLRAGNSGVPCVMLSFDGSAAARDAALSAGAARYLVKTAASREVIARTIVEVAGSGARSEPVPPPDRHGQFDALDRAILAKVMEELNNEAIAEQLSVSVSTVAHRRAKMIEAVGAGSVVGLARYAVRTGLYKL
jgi:DNA-binding NarL/FixJ family response regulator